MSKLHNRFVAGMTSTVVLVAPVTTFAATQFTDVPEGNWAEEAINYGVEQGYLHGQSDSVFGYGQEIKRQDAAVMIASAVYGSSDLVPEGVPSFVDVSSSSYAAKYIAALEQFGIVGNGEGYFSPIDTVTRAEFAQMIVQAFDLEDNGVERPDFTDVLDGAWYDNAITIIASQYHSLGYPDGTWKPDVALTREEAAKFIYGVHSELTAIEVPEPVGDIALESVTVVDVNKIEVAFNQAVDTELADIELVKGQANYNVTTEWNEDGDTATLVSAGRITPDRYTVKVDGLTDNVLQSSVVVEEEEIVSLGVTSPSIEISSGAAIYFNVYNQYGTPYTAVDASDFTVVVNESIDDVTFGKVSVDESTDEKGNLVAEFPIVDANNKLKEGDKFKVTAVYGDVTVESSVKFVEPSNITSLEFGTVTPLDGSERITVGDKDLVVPYVALDQYGEDYELTLEEGITFVSSDKDVVDVDSFAINKDGQLTFDVGEEEGTTTITAILPDGATSQFKVTVKDEAVVSSVVISAPSTLVADGEIVSLDLVVKDQYGEVIPNEEVTGLTFSHDFVINKKTGKLEGIVTEDDTFEVTASKSGKELSSVTFTVEEEAIVNKMTSVDFDTVYEVGATGTITADDVVVLDQYGREFTPSSVELEEKDTSNDYFSGSGDTVVAEAAGEKIYTVVVDDTEMKDIMLRVVASDDITSYELAPLGTLYNGTGYSVIPELIGATADGQDVVLKDGKVDKFTSSDMSVAVPNGLTIVGAGNTFTSTTDKTIVIKAWDETGKELGSTDLVVTNKAPKIETITPSDKDIDIVADIFDSVDQYGGEFTEKGTWYFTSTDGSASVVSVTDGMKTLASDSDNFDLEDGDYSVRFISEDGNTVATTVITVK